ncbi:MAG: S8 family peptidase, partial [Planctomycetota bacterium]
MPNPTKSLTSLAAILAVCLTPAHSQQPTSEAVPGSYIIRLERRPAALEELRDLIRAGAGVSRTNAKIEELAAWVERQSDPVAKSAEELGARVGERWWILPGLRVDDVSPEALAVLRRHPDVASVHPNRIHAPLNDTARNFLHHRADQVEQMNLPNGQRIDGSGVAVAVLDSGAARDFAGTGLPHPAYFPGGDQTQTTGPGLDGSRLLAAYGTSGFGIEDQDGHGAHVSGSVGSAAAGYRGIAQGSSIVSIKVSHPPIANATSAALIAAWQLTVQTRPQHDIRVANNSYSGSPDLTDPTQVALDNAAYVGDLLVVCSAGNAGADTTRSQNCWNGLAVGNVLKSSLAANSRSAQGPLAIFGRTFPDIAAVGTLVQSTALDTASPAVLTGTSMAAPMVAGAGALLFQARPDLTAIEAKAILLGSTRHTQTAPNTLGRGVLDAKAAVDRALGDGFTTLRFEGDEDRLGFVHCVEEPGPVRITAAWMHPGGQAFDNVDLRVYDGSQLIVADLNPLTSYEHVEFMGVPGRRYHVELSRPMPASPSTLEVAVSISNHDFRPDSPVRFARTFHIAEIGTRLDKTIGSPNDRYFADLGRVQLHADLSYTRTADTFEMSDGGAVSISPDSGIGFYTTTEGDGRIHLDAGGTRAGTTAILDRSGTWAVFGRDDRPRVPYTGTRTPAE